MIEYVFRKANQSSESIPLLKERIAVMREVGFILCNVGGSLFCFLELEGLIPRLRVTEGPLRVSSTSSNGRTMGMARLLTW